jgi:hypothetical protein
VKLGDWLLSKGKITEDQLARALHDQTFYGERLGTSLIKLGFVDEDTLGEYLADLAHTRYAPAQRLESIRAEVIAAVPPRLAAKYRIVPIAIEGRKLHLAMRDPKDLIALDEIAFLTGLSIEPYVATEYRLVKAIERHYQIALETKKTIPVSGSTQGPTPPKRGATPAPAPASAKPAQPEIGLDGLPIDADPDPFDQPFVASRSTPTAAPQESEEPVPASLAAWREAQQEIPEVFPEKAGAAGRRGATAAAPAPARHEPARAAAVLASPVAAPVAPPLTMEAISGRLRAAETRDEVFDAVLDFAAARLRRAALFIVQQDRALGWSGRGEGLTTARIRNVAVPFDRPSLFVFFRSGGDYFYGPVPDLPANARFYLDMGCPPPARVLLLPLTIKDKPSVLLYADNASEATTAPDVQQFRRLLQKAALALEVLILRNKIMMI